MPDPRFFGFEAVSRAVGLPVEDESEGTDEEGS